MKPRLTIITPSLNQARFIERTLRSVLDQGYENLEYIVVDGASTDGSAELIEEYADRLAWWVSEPDEGQTAALNKGLRRATGDYVAYINSDDYYLPGAFETAVGALESTGARWLAGACRFLDLESRLQEVWRPKLPGRRRQWWALDPWGVPQAATFWRRDVFEEFGLFREDMHYVFDTEYGLRLAYAGTMPALIEKQLAARVLHDQAKSWDLRPFHREMRRFDALFRPAMTPRERAYFSIDRRLLDIGWFRATGAGSRAFRRVVPSQLTAKLDGRQ